MSKYLYGSSVQGIQSFIFETGKLKEIIGASEIVEQICTSKFKEKVDDVSTYLPENQILAAAGKIIYLFDDKASCEWVVYDFHKSIFSEIPGINLVQAVVKIEDGILKSDDFQELENRLTSQKNKALIQHSMGLMVSERSRRTGGAAVIKDYDSEGNWLDRKQAAKIETQRDRNKLFEKILGEGHGYGKEEFALEPEQMLFKSNSETVDWVAIVHADGNGLGQVIQHIHATITKEYPDSDVLHKVMSSFSKELDKSTRAAAKEAYEKIVAPVFKKELGTKLPLRPVVLGGDDLTLIIRGELAIPFTEVFLKKFSHHTAENFKDLVTKYNLTELKNGLTACAGIAFIKPKYPFHYGVDLSESLCRHAKNITKTIDTSAPSCLMFHRVESSFVGDYNSILESRLTTKLGIQLSYGPYFVEPQSGYSTVKTLLRRGFIMQQQEAPKAPIREWLTILAENPEKANQLMERIRQLNGQYLEDLSLANEFTKRGEVQSTHLHDLLVLDSIGEIDKTWRA